MTTANAQSQTILSAAYRGNSELFLKSLTNQLFPSIENFDYAFAQKGLEQVVNSNGSINWIAF